MPHPEMKLPENAFRRALAEGRKQIGLWSSLGSNVATEMLAVAGFDWILIDTEHSPNEPPDVLQMLQAMNYPGATAAPVVRPAWNDAVLIKRLLDIGVANFIVPMVQNAEEARRAVAATRYPPRGIRGVAGIHRGNGFGLHSKEYFARAHELITMLVQVETRKAVENIPEIAAVEGVDGIFVGPADLSADLGYLGDMEADVPQAVIRQALKACQAAGKPAGILVRREEDAMRWLDEGFTFVALGSDANLLMQAARDLALRGLKRIGRG